MSAFARSWRYNELAWSTFESMEGVGLTPDRYSYHILLNACGVDGNLNSAAKVLDKMFHAGVAPDSATCVRARTACRAATAPQHAAAVRAVGEFAALAMRTTLTPLSILFHTRRYSAMIGVYARAQQWRASPPSRFAPPPWLGDAEVFDPSRHAYSDDFHRVNNFETEEFFEPELDLQGPFFISFVCSLLLLLSYSFLTHISCLFFDLQADPLFDPDDPRTESDFMTDRDFAEQEKGGGAFAVRLPGGGNAAAGAAAGSADASAALEEGGERALALEEGGDVEWEGGDEADDDFELLQAEFARLAAQAEEAREGGAAEGEGFSMEFVDDDDGGDDDDDDAADDAAAAPLRARERASGDNPFAMVDGSIGGVDAELAHERGGADAALAEGSAWSLVRIAAGFDDADESLGASVHLTLTLTDQRRLVPFTIRFPPPAVSGLFRVFPLASKRRTSALVVTPCCSLCRVLTLSSPLSPALSRAFPPSTRHAAE